MLRRPGPDEYNEYYGRYIDRVPDGDVLDVLRRGVAETRSVLSGASADRETYRYAPGKWSIREVIGHVLDTERTFGYRALAFARLDTAPYPSMDQDDYAAASNAYERPLTELMAEFAALREANVLMFGSFATDVWDRRGVASGNEFTVRSLPYIIAGHEIWHREVIRQRYLPA
ncbi:MAG: DinB family protein [Gemmatimonadota bacterium]